MMRCRRIRSELLWLARFGEFGPSSAPHLEHLSRCRECRDEIGFDRALVQQLRAALLERSQAAAPSPDAWGVILRRSQQPEPRRGERVLGWFGLLAARLRVATAMAGTGLALVLALNMQVISLSEPPSDDAGAREVTQLTQVPRLPIGKSARTVQSAVPVDPGREQPDPEREMTRVRARIASLQPSVASEEETDQAPPEVELRVVFRALQTPEPGVRDAGGSVTELATPASVEMRPGEPS